MKTTPKATILVVDDDNMVRLLVQKKFEMDNYRVLTAENGLEAIRILSTEHPDLIISDIIMPGMGGIEFCQKVRANPKQGLIPFIFLSIKDKVADKVVGIEAGADDYIAKPFHPKELVIRVEALLRTARRFRELAKDEINKPHQTSLPEPEIITMPERGSFDEGKQLFNKGLYDAAYEIWDNLLKDKPVDKEIKRWRDLSEINFLREAMKVFVDESNIPQRVTDNQQEIVGLAKGADEYYLWSCIDGRTSFRQLTTLMPDKSRLATYQILLRFVKNGLIRVNKPAKPTSK